MLGAGALGQPREMVWGGRREEGSGWGTYVYLWQIHFDIWQNQYNIVKLNKIKFKKKKRKKSGDKKKKKRTTGSQISKTARDGKVSNATAKGCNHLPHGLLFIHSQQFHEITVPLLFFHCFLRKIRSHFIRDRSLSSASTHLILVTPKVYPQKNQQQGQSLGACRHHNRFNVLNIKKYALFKRD